MIPRLNRGNHAQNWLSMQPNPLSWYSNYSEIEFGEVNEKNRLHGRGIGIWNDGFIGIGYFENGKLSTGKYITIFYTGSFKVGECYMKDRERWFRYTQYKTNGKAYNNDY
jgi:hypothetical protein